MLISNFFIPTHTNPQFLRYVIKISKSPNKYCLSTILYSVVPLISRYVYLKYLGDSRHMDELTGSTPSFSQCFIHFNGKSGQLFKLTSHIGHGNALRLPSEVLVNF